ncbi:MAG TPA: NAD(P)/FAD-dependent oxidoreductase [Casimicrobiaceae bacterium]|jgi:NADPH-dependent 2,4-dienoyl-CoA reductase/sulfur reductase-like enzyme
MDQQRREFLAAAGALAGAAALPGCATTGGGTAGKVVVVGGGYGGATAAKYLRMWSNGTVGVTLIESRDSFVSCPLSNLVIGGSRTIADITVPYDQLGRRWGVDVVRDTATAVDVDKRVVTTAGGRTFSYDRLVLSPGIEFIFDAIPSYRADPTRAVGIAPHAWQAGPQTVLLRQQLEAMPDGGTYAIVIPVAPYRCPPGPYERVCQVAWYLKRAKPRSKIVVCDGNPDVTSKAALFKKAWAEEYRGLIEYRPNNVLTDVDLATRTAKFETADDVKAGVLNVVPPQRAGAIARAAGVITANNRWCEVDFRSFESVRGKGVHVLGDAIQIAQGMPKSGHMANNHAKIAAAAILRMLAGQEPNPNPVLTNTCYSYITDKDVVHVASVHQWDADKKTVLPVPNSGGLSPAMNELEGTYANAWARNIWSDMLG